VSNKSEMLEFLQGHGFNDRMFLEYITSDVEEARWLELQDRCNVECINDNTLNEILILANRTDPGASERFATVWKLLSLESRKKVYRHLTEKGIQNTHLYNQIRIRPSPSSSSTGGGTRCTGLCLCAPCLGRARAPVLRI